MSALGPTAERPAAPGGSEQPALSLRGVCARYGALTVLRDVDLDVPPGKVVALLGANGAGKTTLLRTAAGLMRPSAGTVRVHGADVTRQDPNRRLRHGLCLIPEGRGIFRNLSVEENLRLSIPPWVRNDGYDSAYEAFPVLKERRRQLAGTMSGGQQQMLALARAQLSQATVVMLDEVSMGLAPVMVDVIFEALHRLAAQGVALLLVEQYVQRALGMADEVHLMKKGVVSHVGRPDDLAADDLTAEYLGQGGAPAASDPAASDPAASGPVASGPVASGPAVTADAADGGTGR